LPGSDTAELAVVERFTMIMQADNWPILRLVRRVDPSAKLALSSGVSETTVPVAAWQTIGTEPAARAG
jgi:hypothetical protein